jgi:predicted dehydrogenase
VVGGEPLRAEIEHFAQCVATGERPLSDGRNGGAVVALLEAAQHSSELGGQPTVVEKEARLAAAA